MGKTGNKMNKRASMAANLLLMLITIGMLTSFYYLRLTENRVDRPIPVKTVLYSTPENLDFDTSGPLVFVSGEYEPYIYTENGEIKGSEYELVKAVLDDMGVDYEIRMMSWARGLYLMDIGDAFAAFPYYRTREREAIYLFSDSLIDTERVDYFYYYSEDDSADEVGVQLDNFGDLNQYKVGGIEGYYYISVFDNLGIPYDLSIDEVECFQKLKEGRIDVFPISKISAEAVINRHFEGDKSNFKRSSFSIRTDYDGEYLMVKRENSKAQAFIMAFNQSLYKIKSGEEIELDDFE